MRRDQFLAVVCGQSLIMRRTMRTDIIMEMAVRRLGMLAMCGLEVGKQ